MTDGFKDLFSQVSSDYSRFRPTYPAELFDYLASLPARRETAWDCGTGNGQAAVELATRFQEVIATDPSRRQLQEAAPHARIRYQVASAEASGIAAGQVDLVTVAQALHWFDQDRFHAETRRVARQDGSSFVAVWCYEVGRIEPGIDQLVEHFYSQVVGPYWQPERRHIVSGYRTLPFPFEEIQAPRLEMTTDWDLPRLLGYFGTWSATQAATRTLGRNPLEEFAPRLARAWGDPSRARTVHWPLHLRVGRIG